MALKFRSNADHTRLISKSIFITNFPEATTLTDLWNLCQSYGMVVDVFIPYRTSKAGKRFAFVCFIKFNNVDRLVENLCNLWIGRMHLQANVARFERPPIQSSHLPQQSKRAAPVATSFASAMKSIQPTSVQPFLVPALNVEIAYLGGLWVMLKLGSTKAKLNLMKHVGVASWFVHLCNAQSDFVANEHIVWVDIEGVPLYVWSRNTFQKIGSKWGEVMELEEGNDDLFSRKCLCIKTKQADNILESFKIIVKGKVFRIRAKELFVWSPSFKEIHEMVHYPDDESVKEDVDNKVEDGSLNKVEDESDTDTDVISNTYFGDNAEQDCVNEVDQMTKDKEVSYDPLNIYDLLNKGNKDTDNLGVESSISYPPGFTPDKVVHAQEGQDARGEDVMQSNSRSDDCNSRVFKKVKKPEVCLSSDGRDSRALRKKGGSILDVLDEMIKLEGYSFTWALSSAAKMSKLDRFLVTDGLLSSFPQLYAVCLDRHLSDHRPILLREILVDFGATPFRIYHSWFLLSGFDQMISSSWNSFTLDDRNGMICFRKKLQLLKKEICIWVADYKKKQTGKIQNLKDQLREIDILLDQGGVTDDILLSCMDLSKQLQDLSSSDNCNFIQKAKVRWAVKGDENSQFFYGIINRKRANLSVKGIMVDGEWVDEPNHVKNEFRTHFADRFNDMGLCHGKLNFSFPNRLSIEQAADLEIMVLNDEIHNAVWGCRENKSSGPDGFTFEFFRCNSSFVTLIPKILEPKLVSDFRPISLIGSIYKVVTKILASRLSNVIFELISNVHTAFLPNRQILDGSFIDDEILSRCKIKNQKAMILPKLRILLDGKASILVNGSPSSEFHFHRGLKQGDPLAPFLFILIMESLHLSFSRAVEAGIFTGFRIDNSLMISHLSYADDAVFIGEWSNENLKGIFNILSFFSLLSGMSINLKKSQILGMGILESVVSVAAKDLGCSVMKAHFMYLGVMVGGNMSLVKAWDTTIDNLLKRLSKWKRKTLSIDGCLTLLKSVLGSSPIYNLSLFKVPKTVLNKMENLRWNFFNGNQEGYRKIAWVKWHTVLASKQYGGLGVSSFFALNRGLLAKWVWCFLSQDNSLWYRVIFSIHNSGSSTLSAAYPLIWSSIINEFDSLKDQGANVFSHCKIRIGNGVRTRFWKDCWIGESRLQGGAEAQQFNHLSTLLDPVILSNSEDRWVCDLSGEGEFRVKDVRNHLDEFFLPKADVPTRWVKVNIFAWKMFLNRLPTRSNLAKRNVVIESESCPLCDSAQEDVTHVFFSCTLVKDLTRLICRWWNLEAHSFSSYAEWLSWLNSLRLGSKLKEILKGIFYVTWWSVWNFRNHMVFASNKPRKESIFDDIVLRSFN
uniref:RNA-directed DNA polymerase, eukaryota n=1 Tax=Tanacetum cinerariifolium TaxID=118510 RepID=A0A6L2MV07_TANCI|nr:RNA-directed DNA polymerase, eukaryota [Tanacetum cinerariifolium]